MGKKRMQRALLQASRPENAELVEKAIRLSGRDDAKILLPAAKCGTPKSNNAVIPGNNKMSETKGKHVHTRSRVLRTKKRKIFRYIK